jgi:hypothetical protein
MSRGTLWHLMNYVRAPIGMYDLLIHASMSGDSRRQVVMMDPR